LVVERFLEGPVVQWSQAVVAVPLIAPDLQFPENALDWIPVLEL
jgi:hypothetical protein